MKTKTKKEKSAWSDYERALLITHYRKFCKANLEKLLEKMPYRTLEGIYCEINRFHIWQKTGIMSFAPVSKHKDERAGTRETYTRIIEELGI